MRIDLGEVTAVCGKKDSGKSVFTEYLLTKMRRFIMLDPMAEHGPPGAVFPESPREVLEYWKAGHQRQVIRDPPLTTDKAMNYVRAAGQLKDHYLIIDEAHDYMTFSSVPEPLKLYAKHHVSHANSGLILNTHQFKNWHDSVFNQIDNYVIFHYGGHEDSKYGDIEIPNKHLIRQIDPTSYQFLFYRDEVGAEASICGPVPLPSHLS